MRILRRTARGSNTTRYLEQILDDDQFPCAPDTAPAFDLTTVYHHGSAIKVQQLSRHGSRLGPPLWFGVDAVRALAEKISA